MTAAPQTFRVPLNDNLVAFIRVSAELDALGEPITSIEWEGAPPPSLNFDEMCDLRRAMKRAWQLFRDEQRMQEGGR